MLLHKLRLRDVTMSLAVEVALSKSIFFKCGSNTHYHTGLLLRGLKKKQSDRYSQLGRVGKKMEQKCAEDGGG